MYVIAARIKTGSVPKAIYWILEIRNQKIQYLHTTILESKKI